MSRVYKILLVLIISIVASNAYAVEWTPLQLSLVSPVQVFPEETKVNGIRVNLIYGVNKGLNGIDYGPVNHTKGVTNGVQAGAFPIGGVNITEDLNGLQIGGIFGGVNISKNFNGLQVAGIFGGVNISNGEDNGLQVSGLFGGVNNAGNLDGAQIGGIWGGVNNAKNLDGVQISGILGGLNMADNLNGVQIAGIFLGINIAEDTNGIQLATIYNQANSMSGLQLGLVNNCKKMRGVQIGLVNIIRDNALPFFPVINASF